jgi:hypothetical protein
VSAEAKQAAQFEQCGSSTSMENTMKSRTPRRAIIGSALAAAVLGAIACGTESQGTGPQDTGIVGGAASVGSGGAANGNGSVSTSSGGSATGGGNNTGGASTSVGGNSTTGGASTNTGGNATTGGASISTGGNAATGGTSVNVGGKAATGGAAATSTGGRAAGGAATSTGGKASTGGRAAGGAATSTGGKASTGGASTSIGGSTATGTKFSFFVISYRAIQAKSGSAQGFGGDLRYGTGDGLAGADKICTEVAEGSMAGNGKTWKAYLSTSSVNAIDRIGEGPWYDRVGRLVTSSKAGLLFTRPQGADSAIANDLPNEDGVPNHAPDGTQVDNHDTLTGTNHLGTLFSSTAHCSNWTSSTASTSARPRVGHTWPRGSTSATGNSPGMAHWGSALDESGCGKGVNLLETGGPGNDGTVGSGGGYGGWYCFATTP